MNKFKLVSRRTYWLSIGASLIYGILMRAMMVWHWNGVAFTIMSNTFLFIVPMIMGYITIATMTQKSDKLLRALFLPWIPVIAGIIFTLIVAWEGSICAIFYVPMAMVMSSLGGFIAWMLGKSGQSKKMMMAMLVLPFMSQPLENMHSPKDQFKTVHSTVEIHADEAAVWNQIKSVPKISTSEMQDSWVHRIGFPRPLDAEIDKESVGGVRLARFERGLTFVETVTDWQENKTLAFNIDVDPKDIPPTALDEHVTIGGPYFDVLNGRYTLERKSKDKIILHLTSEFRLSTNFNWYADFWTERVMQRIQGDILSVVKKRAEQKI
ncbi:MAG: hypothetical protein KDD33_05080 [Bdellovibrionales bacterium]|nr:hypothetical protein [Bdellovibrionales bacterium]